MVIPTARPILAPSLKPPDEGVDMGVDVAATDEGSSCDVLSAALPCLLDVVVVVAAAVDCGRERVVLDNVVEEEDLDVEAGMLTVVKGAPSSRVLILGSWWQGWSRSCWQQKESLLAKVVMPLPRSTMPCDKTHQYHSSSSLLFLDDSADSPPRQNCGQTVLPKVGSVQVARARSVSPDPIS